MKKAKCETVLDERQEQKLLLIESRGMRFAFWALFAAIIIQPIINGEDVLQHIAGEFIIFLCLGGYIIVACLKNGIWERKSKPSLKINLIVSIVAGLFVGIFNGVLSYVLYGKVAGSLATALFVFGFTFILSFAALSFAVALYRKRVKTIEGSIDQADAAESGAK